MTDIFDITRTYSTLSIPDLLLARDQYHYQLMNKANVIATAIGYYRIRKKEHWPSRKDPHPDNSEFKDEPRTLPTSQPVADHTQVPAGAQLGIAWRRRIAPL